MSLLILPTMQFSGDQSSKCYTEMIAFIMVLANIIRIRYSEAKFIDLKGKGLPLAFYSEKERNHSLFLLNFFLLF